MFAVYKKELKSYFLPPTGYITIGLFLLLFSLFFYLTPVSVGGYDMGNLYFATARIWFTHYRSNSYNENVCGRKKKWNRTIITNIT